MFTWILIIIVTFAIGILNFISPAPQKVSLEKRGTGVLSQGWPGQLFGLFSLFVGLFMVYASTHFFGGLYAIHFFLPNWAILLFSLSLSLLGMFTGLNTLRNWGEYDDWGFCWHSILGKKTYVWSEMTDWKFEEDSIYLYFGHKEFYFHSGWNGNKKLNDWLKNKEQYFAYRRQKETLIKAVYFGKI